MRHRIIDSPLGRLALVEDPVGALVAVLAEGQKHAPKPEAMGERDDTVAGEASEQLQAYFAGQLDRFDLRTAPRGTDFQRRVWGQISLVPYGETRTYGEVALALGVPTASRAVGAATGRNPLSIVVPCHRLVGASGALTGYAGGLERKRWLLDLEQGRLSG